MLSICSHVKFMKLTPQPNPNPHLCLTEYFQLTFTLTFNYYIFFTKKHTKTTLIRHFLINVIKTTKRLEMNLMRSGILASILLVESCCLICPLTRQTSSRLCGSVTFETGMNSLMGQAVSKHLANSQGWPLAFNSFWKMNQVFTFFYRSLLIPCNVLSIS